LTGFRLSRQAQSDLKEIHAYIADDNSAAADQLIDRFFDHFHRLVQHPKLGTSRDDLMPGLRIWSEVATPFFISSRMPGLTSPM